MYSSNEINRWMDGWMDGLLGSRNYKRGKYFLYVLSAMFLVLSENVVTSMCVCTYMCYFLRLVGPPFQGPRIPKLGGWLGAGGALLVRHTLLAL